MDAFGARGIMKRNLFDKLLNKEDDYTNIFCNLICQNQYRNILEQTLNINEIFDKQIIGIETNQAKEKGSKPDAIIKFAHNITILFEVKISTWRNLTNNQPESYLDYLSKQNGVVFFILLIPIGYQHLNEFEERYKKWEIKNDKTIQLRIVYWQNIYQNIKQNSDDLVLTNFADMLDLEHMEEIVSMDDNEINLLENDFIFQYNKKIKDIIEYAVSGLIKKGLKCEKSKDDDGLNYYIMNKKNEILYWFGTWDPLSEKGHLLVIGCNFAHKFASRFKNCEFISDQYYAPFTKDKILDKNNIGESYFNYVYSFYEKSDI